MRLRGFTLEVDGNPEEVKRLFDAVAAEYGAIQRDAHDGREASYALLGLPPDRTRAGSSLHGRIELRETT